MGNSASLNLLSPEASSDHLLKQSTRTLLWAIGWRFIHAGSQLLVKRTALQKLEGRQRERAVLYVNSMIHAVCVTAYAVYKLISDLNERPSVKEQLTNADDQNLLIGAFTFGYFINDFIQMRQDWFTHPVDVIHHVVAFLVCAGALSSKLASHFVPHYLLVEGSTIFLDAMWFCRSCNDTSSKVFRWSKYAFAATFFALRVVWMPALTAFVVAKRNEVFTDLGLTGKALIPACILQWYWFAGVLRVALGAKAKSK